MFKSQPPSTAQKNTIKEPELTPIYTGEELLATERRQQLLKILPSLSQLPPREYQSLYLKLVEFFAEFVQSLPETRHGYYPYAGGLLDHGLERAVRAVALSRNFMGSEEGDTKEVLLKQARLRYAIFSAALLYDLGKLATKLTVMITGRHNAPANLWCPYEGSMLGLGTHYQYVFEKENWDYLRVMITPLLARQLMKSAGKKIHKESFVTVSDGFIWIAQDKEILETWFAFFKEDSTQMNSVLSIIPLADAQTIANYFDLDRPLQELAQPTASFWDKYGAAIQQFTDEMSRAAEVDKAIKRKVTNEKITNEKTIRVTDEAVKTTRNTEDNKMQDNITVDENQVTYREKELPLEMRPLEDMASVVASRKAATVPATLAAGLAFFRWLMNSVRDHVLSVNTHNSMIHRVNEGVLLTQELFQQFVNTQTQYKNVDAIRKQLVDLGFVLMNGANKSSFQYSVDRPGISENKEGMILRNAYLIFQELPPVNKTLHLVGESLKNFATSKIILQNLANELPGVNKTLLPGSKRTGQSS
ncbi:MAG: hypothetical protein ACD_44C00399G0004 [uncultured bacterium]|nr:MAG: hypothetical protein ACD_44C00399G0004 [uncultured bacterium]